MTLDHLSDRTARAENLLQAGWAVIAERGFGSFRIADVARKAGVSTGTVHYYFPTKRELLLAAFEHKIQQAVLQRRWVTMRGETPIARLRAFVDEYLPDDEESVQTWRIWAEFWAEGLHDESVQAINQRAYGSWRLLFEGLFREAQDEGEILPGDVAFMASAFVAMMDGLALQTILQSDDMTAERMRRTCLDFIALLSP
jgi:AcrR family transcriptional regulator